MKSCMWILLIGALAMTAPANLLAAEAWAYRVYQPFNLPNGIAVSPVTYTGYYTPGAEVVMTCWANRVWHPDPDWRGSVHKALQENVAFTAGLRVRKDSLRGRPVTGQGDTVWVTLDASRLAPLGKPIERADTILLAATVECMKANAGQWAEIHFLALRISGPRKYARFGGIFDVRDYRCGPKKRQVY